MNYTIEEQAVSQIARSFAEEDNTVVSSVNSLGRVAVSLAQQLYRPSLHFLQTVRGKRGMLSNVCYPYVMGQPPEKCIETLLNMEDSFDFVVSGKYSILMQPVQIDQYGYTNLSLIGDKSRPKMAFVGSRGVPDNTVNSRHVYYYVPNHQKRVFVKKVDFISGVGYGVERREGIIKWGAPYKVFSNLGVFGFDQKTGQMQVISVYSGVSTQQIKDNTDFDLININSAPEAEPPTAEELHLIRKIIDPSGIRYQDFPK